MSIINTSVTPRPTMARAHCSYFIKYHVIYAVSSTVHYGANKFDYCVANVHFFDKVVTFSELNITSSNTENRLICRIFLHQRSRIKIGRQHENKHLIKNAYC